LLPTTKAAKRVAIACLAAAATCTLAARPSWAEAAGAAAGEHLHIGQKVAKAFQSTGLPDEAVLMLISAMPVIELRGGVPVGVWMGMAPAKVLALCVVGNMLPIAPILLALRSQLVQKVHHTTPHPFSFLNLANF